MTDLPRRLTRVLLVDDNEQVRRSLSKLIENGVDHCLVTTAADSAEALGALTKRSYDIALCDLALTGDLDGISVTRQIKATCPEVRVVVFTGEVTENRKKEALEAGAFIYLAKPYKSDELLHLIEALASIRRTENQTHWFETLTRLASNFQATFDYERIAHLVVEGARMLGFACARLYVFDEDRKVLIGKAASCGSELNVDFERYEIPIEGHTIIRSIFDSAQPEICDLKTLRAKSPESANEQWIGDLELSDLPWIDCPLQVDGRRVGTLAVDHRGEEDTRCTQEDLEIIGLFSVLAAKALHNSTLYTQEALVKASLISLLQDAPDALITTDLNGIINFVSPSGERVTTWPSDEMLGKAASEFYTDVDDSSDVGRQIAREVMAKVRAAGTLRNMEVYIKARQGPPLPMRTSVSLLHDEKGEEIGTLAFLKNRSPLEAEARRYRDLLEGYGNGTVLLTCEGLVEFTNRKAEELLCRRRRRGNPHGELQGTHFADLLRGDQREEFQRKFSEILAGGEEVPVDLYVVRPDTTQGTLKARMNPTFSKDRINGVILALYDLKEIGAFIQSGRLMALGQMVGGVAHEINNPLNNLSSAAHNLREDLQADGFLTESRRQLLDMIGRGSHRIADLVNRMKEFGSPSDISMGPISLNQVIKDTVSFFQTRLENHGIHLELTLQPDLPLVWGDHKRLQQVFVNLLSNAEEALQGQEQPQQIFLKTETASPSQVHASVSDSGCGIPERILESVFDPFFTTRSNDGGTGLGLSICKTIMDLHQGKIHVTGGPGGRGTTFHLTLLRVTERNLRTRATS